MTPVPPPEAGGYVWRRRTRKDADGTLTIEETALPIASLWSLPLSLTATAAAFGLDRGTLADRVASGEIVVRPCGALIRVRADHCPPKLLAPLFAD